MLRLSLFTSNQLEAFYTALDEDGIPDYDLVDQISQGGEDGKYNWDAIIKWTDPLTAHSFVKENRIIKYFKISYSEYDCGPTCGYVPDSFKAIEVQPKEVTKIDWVEITEAN